MAQERRGSVNRTLRYALATALILAGPQAMSMEARAAEPDNGKLTATDNGKADKQSTDNLEPSLLATLQRQEKLDSAVTLLTEAAMKLPNGGFTSIEFEGDGLALYWKGTIPSSMVEALSKARMVGPVQVRSAPYSKAELENEAAKIESAAQGPDNIQAIKIRHDGSGLIVEKMPPVTAVQVRARAGVGLLTAEQAILRAEVSVPVLVRTATTSMAPLACAGGVCRRTDDEAWWNSGGRVWMNHETGGAYYGKCTSGFAVTVPAWGGRTALLTAAHCATWRAGQGDWFHDGADELIGRASVNEDWDKDIMLIDAPGWYWMWDGSPTTTNHKTVHSWGYAVGNESVCQSGATSGTRCSLQTDSNFNYSYQLTDSDGDTFTVHGMVMACRTSGSAPAGQPGDSGAPVFTLDGDGVRAKGVLSGGDDSCILFQDMEDVTTDRDGAWVHVWPYTG